MNKKRIKRSDEGRTFILLFIIFVLIFHSLNHYIVFLYNYVILISMYKWFSLFHYFCIFLCRNVITDKKYKNIPVTLTVARICINHKTQCTLSILMSIAANDIWKLQFFFSTSTLTFFFQHLSLCLVVQIICN